MATVPKISFPVPANAAGKEFGSSDALLDVLNGESSGLYLVGSQGMWHGGVHITNATVPWCALTGKNASELAYVHTPYKGEQAVRCMADGEIVAYRACQDYDFIEWGNDKLYFSSSFVLVKHAIQPDENAEHGLTFHTLYMNLAPVSAYAQTDGDLRKTAKNQNYYATSADVQSNHSAGTLQLNTQVRLGDQVVNSESKHRQYSEVTVMVDTGALAAGDKVWTVSDQGWLKPASDQGAAVPSWWNKCSPAIHPGTVNAPLYKTSAGLKYYLSSADAESGIAAETKAGLLDNGCPVFYDANNAALQFTRSDGRLFSLVTLGKDVAPQKKGDRVWVVSDNDNLVADGAGSSAGQAVYGQVVNLSPPIKIAAGDSIGHLGFYELPKDNGKLSRYQVHIECLSMDPQLPTFLTNPGNVGRDAPTYLSYPEDAVLMMPDATGKMTATDRKTRAPGILTRTKVPGVDAEGHVLADNKGAEQYQVRPEGGWLAKGDVKQLSQYDLAALGFMTLDKAPESFDLIDGIHHPDNVVKGILEQLYKAAQGETRSSHAMNQYNYKRLLDQIDQNHDGHYSEDEYLQAIHNPSYRSHLYRLIVKHPSEWYYGKEDPFWKGYLDTLATDAPLWKAYTESFIEKMAWMKKVEGMGPEPWHMHPVVFLSSFDSPKCDCEKLYADKFKATRYGSQYGPVYWGNTSLSSYSRWDNLITAGEITTNEKMILIAMSENEGKMDSVQSYDSEVITAGAMQKTVKDGVGLEGKGEFSTQFATFRDKHQDLYQQYAVSCGWSVTGSGSSAVIYYSDATLTDGEKITSTALKTLVRQGCNVQTFGYSVYNKPLAALVKVLSLPEYLDLQVIDFIKRLHSAESKVVTTNGNKISDFVQSNFGRAVVLDHSVNRPGNVGADFKKAIDNFHIHNPTVSLDPNAWGTDHDTYETKLLEEYKLTRRMTDSTLRFNSLKAKL